MWAAIGAILTTFLPFLSKLILYIIDNKTNNDKLKEEFLKFLSNVETDMPIKLHDKYNDQIARIKAQLEKENADRGN